MKNWVWIIIGVVISLSLVGIAHNPQALSAKCDDDAKTYFNKGNFNQSEYILTTSSSYKDRYDSKTSSCYMLYNYDFKMKDNPDGTYSTKITYTLIDLYKQMPGGGYDTIGNYNQSISQFPINNRLDDCNVAGMQCTSLDIFLRYINPYVGNIN